MCFLLLPGSGTLSLALLKWIVFFLAQELFSPWGSGGDGGSAHLGSLCSEGRGRQISEFKASLVYRVSFRIARVTV